jgi:predicted secreted protein
MILPFTVLLVGLLFGESVLAESEEAARNRASFQVEATREVANDWATARLAVVAEGKDAAAVSATVNRQMATTLATAKRSEGIKVESGAYTTQPVYDDGRVVRWRARQEIRVESGDVDRLSGLIGTLQGDSVLLTSIEFSVKPETRRALEETLIEEALRDFRSRASLIAKGMGEKSWSLISLSVGHAGVAPRMLQTRVQLESVSSSHSPPASFEAGTSEIQIQVNGIVELD